ncbi:serine-protein kinase ATM isoform X2 [Protopterus annectens]|uniref:serine-protein kinase ATM isoform X2 n=1 Tax=Protopterus annectens TaxID=7888 RepID=UPI001CF96502|nr:serine-protein kinase ATM isoform X2 [Protopterus annectens]
MSVVLHELLLCCRHLENDKATERKKEVENFKRLIRSSETVKQLDQNSESKHSKQLNWDAVFRFLQRYIQKETECLQTAKANVSAITQANRQKKMQEISSLVKYFIRCANKRGPRLKCVELLNYIMDTLRDPFTCIAYGADISSILLKDVLSVRKYWCEITHIQWEALVSLYCSMYLKSSKDINRVLTARIIHTLVKGCCDQTEGLPHRLFEFFSKAIQNAKMEKISAALGHILAALNAFLNVSAINSRIRVCRLGEEIIPTLLYIWVYSRPQDSLKEEIIEILHLQLRVHHPKGAKTTETGAYADDWEKWQSLLYHLYDTVVNEINQIGSRGKYSCGSRHIAMKDSLVDFTADICHQVFTQETKVLEITQPPYATTQRQSLQQGTPSKRRRIELGWEVIRDNLQKSQNDFDIIPWLQITCSLVAKYPSSLPASELAPLLTVLHQLLCQQRRGARTPYVLRCFTELAICQSKKATLREGQRLDLQKLWTRIWSVTLRSISSQQTESKGFGLLCAIIRGNLLLVDKDFWKIFYGTVCKPSSPAVTCLAWALAKCIIPEQLEFGNERSMTSDGDAAFSSREAILKWLLSFHTEEDSEENVEPPAVICKEFPHLLVSKTLVGLTIKDSRSGVNFMNPFSSEGVVNLEDKEDAGFSTIELLYLQTTFAKMPVCPAASVNDSSKDSAPSGITVNPTWKEKLEGCLSTVAEQLLNTYSSETTPGEYLIRCAGLLVSVLGCYCFIGAIPEEEACKSNLFQKAKSLLQHAGETISVLKNKLNEESKLASLRSLVASCIHFLQTKGNASRICTSLFLQLLTSRFLNDLSEVCRILVTSTRKNSEATETDLMEEDLDESTMDVQDHSNIDLFEDDTSPSTDSAELHDSGELQFCTGVKSPLAEEKLTKQDILLLDTLKFLCGCAGAAHFHSFNFRPADIRKKLLVLIDGQNMDMALSFHLHMYLTLLNEFPNASNILPAEDIGMLLRPLNTLCSTYRRDQEVCASILTHLLPLTTALGQDRGNAEELSDVQGQLLTVIGAFWHLSKEGRCTVLVRTELLKCMRVLLEVDPYCKWAILHDRDKDEDVLISDAFPLFLTDSSHQVRMLAAVSIKSLFQQMGSHHPGKLKAFPLKKQQKAFENVYMRVQEGMRLQSQVKPEDRADEECNRRATLLMLISEVLCSTSVCEKQALFAICQSVKENGLSSQLIRKVLETVSKSVGYRNLEVFMNSHLDYLVFEWLRVTDTNYTLSTFPCILLNYSTLEEFYRSCYNVLIPHLVVKNDFEAVKSMAGLIMKDWKQLLAECFPKVIVNILPYFAYQGGNESGMSNQRDNASKVYDFLKDDDCLGKQQIDNLIHNSLSEIVVELLMTLHESPAVAEEEGTELLKFAGEMDPVPNPPHFPSYIIKITLDYINSCHKTKQKSIVAILSKNPDSIQRILLAICKQAAETTNIYEKHRILMVYHLFVNLLLNEIKEGLGGAWAFVLRDVIYTLIHHINDRPSVMDDVSTRSFSLCCNLLYKVCHSAVKFCKDALGKHLHVIVGTLIPLVSQQSEIQPQVLSLLKFLVIDNKDNENIYHAIKSLDPFPDLAAFKDLRAVQQRVKYGKGPFTLLEEINHFLSASFSDSLPLTRLEGLLDLKKQLELHKDQLKDLIKEFQDSPQNSFLVHLVVSLLELSKAAVHHSGGYDILEAVGSCLGEMGPVDFSTIALENNKDALYSRAVELFDLTKSEFRWIFVVLNLLNAALTDKCIEVRSAAATCLKNILATQLGNQFWEVHKNNDPMLRYLMPFKAAKRKLLELTRPAKKDDPAEKLDDAALWIPANVCLENWLMDLTCALLDSRGVENEILLLSRPMCEVKTDFCQVILPFLIHDILLHDANGEWCKLLSSQVQGFFSASCKVRQVSSRSTTPANTDSEPESLNHGNLDKTSCRTMLAVVDYLRRQHRPQKGSELVTVWNNNFWLDLNYLEVAMAAQSCAAHFTALLYAEIYANKIKLDDEELKRSSYKASRCLKFEEQSQGFTISDLSERSREETGISLQDLLMEIYRSIGEPDSLYGCGGGKMLHPLARIRTYEHEAMWGKALVTYDLEMNLSAATRQAGIMQAMQNFGLCSTLTTYLKGLEYENADWCTELQEVRYQAAWRNMQWNYASFDRGDNYEPGRNESIYKTLQSLRDHEFNSFYDGLKFARVKEVKELCKGSLESVYALYPTLSRLQALTELESVGQLFVRPFCDIALKDVYCKWQKQLHLLKDSDFNFLESVLALRTVILETLLENETDDASKDSIKDILTKHLMQLSEVARTASNTQLPERAIFQIKQHIPARFGVALWQLEEAQVFWAKKEQSLALASLRQLIDKLTLEVEYDPSLAPMYAECLRLSGIWLAETCLENPGIIIQRYLEKAAEVAESHSSTNSEELKSARMKAFLSLARFSDAQYQGIENYMKSSEFENKQTLLKKAKDEVDLMIQKKVTMNRYTVKVQRELELDERALHALLEDRKRFLCKAVENYISCLESGEDHDIWIFRLCSLWLDNSVVPEVNEMMKCGAKKIPSYKFLPLMYQLAARMGTKMPGGKIFHEVLNHLISQTSLNHPHHTMFIILALANANKDDTLGLPEVLKRSKLSKNAPRELSQLDEERMDVARSIVENIKKCRPQMVQDIERLCDAYIILANMDANQWKAQRKGIKIPADQPITRIVDLDDVVIPTMEIKVDPSGKYENLVTISRFKPEFRLAGGVNLPKIIDCVGSDGKERRQLVKGRDDLRQDAVMQQVFQMCNSLLQRNSETRKRKLTIRRYKVVPLSQRSGVLEWCSGTIPIGEFLVNQESGAHRRYRPKDWSSLQCRKKLTEVQKEGSEGKYQAFMEVCQNFQPVFRYFCMERFLDPAVWFEKRLAYTRSVATSSIVGYIVGLGDRHVQNILIDEQTAELIHIDLGVAFEQGKILPTPERVPFRLTGDIVDGMGITGVEGVFRRCCEKTMDVMRNSQEALLTIVQVLLYDPLFDWTMNPLKAFYLRQRHEEDTELNSTLNATIGGDEQDCNRKNSSDTQSFNKVAERVLLRLQEKLKGVEEGTVLSVGGQVNLLIQQAMDPKNLSQLFPGWQPWV